MHEMVFRDDLLDFFSCEVEQEEGTRTSHQSRETSHAWVRGVWTMLKLPVLPY